MDLSRSVPRWIRHMEERLGLPWWLEAILLMIGFFAALHYALLAAGPALFDLGQLIGIVARDGIAAGASLIEGFRDAMGTTRAP